MPELADHRGQRLLGGAQILGGDRERHLSVTPLGQRLVLDDRVDVAAGLGEGGEDRGCSARPVGHAHERDPSLLDRVRDGGDQRLLHRFVLSNHNGTRPVLEARAAVDPDTVRARVLDGPQLQDLRA